MVLGYNLFLDVKSELNCWIITYCLYLVSLLNENLLELKIMQIKNPHIDETS